MHSFISLHSHTEHRVMSIAGQRNVFSGCLSMDVTQRTAMRSAIRSLFLCLTQYIHFTSPPYRSPMRPNRHSHYHCTNDARTPLDRGVQMGMVIRWRPGLAVSVRSHHGALSLLFLSPRSCLRACGLLEGAYVHKFSHRVLTLPCCIRLIGHMLTYNHIYVSSFFSLLT